MTRLLASDRARQQPVVRVIVNDELERGVHNVPDQGPPRPQQRSSLVGLLGRRG